MGTSGGSYGSYISKWTDDNAQAEATPLSPGVRLSPLRPTPFDYDEAFKFMIPAPDWVEPGRRNGVPDLQSIARSPSIPQGEVGADFTLILLEPLRTGPDKYAQVWVVERLSPATLELPNSRMVLKLFQESLFPYADFVDFKIYYEWSALAQSHRESWAYTRLKPLQGTLIPHSYGFFDFSLPCGQVVCGHLMEYIEGRPLERDYQGMIDGSWYTEESQARKKLRLERLALCIHMLHLSGVHHGDLSPSNVLVPSAAPDTFVVIDFGLASPLCMIEGVVGKSDGGGLWQCAQEVEDVTVVAQWLADGERSKADWAWGLGAEVADMKSNGVHIEKLYCRQAEQRRLDASFLTVPTSEDR